MLDPDAPDTVSESNQPTASTPPPPRRRRAASRPAGPPAPAPERQPELLAPAAPAELDAPQSLPELENREPSDVEAQLVTVEPEAADEPEATAEQEAAAEPEAPIAPPVPDETEAPAEPETPTEPDSGADTEPEAERVDAPAAAEPESPAEDEAVAEASESAVDAPPEVETKRGRGRRRKKEPAPEPDGEPVEGGVAASLAALEQDRPAALDDSLANPFRAPADVAAVLDGLAAAIGDAGERAVSDDEPEDDEVSDDEGDGNGDAEDEGSDGQQRRRRRRRGGRRRRRGSDSRSDDEDADDETPGDDSDDEAADEAETSEDEGGSDGNGEDAPSEGSGRRRRRRRRRGEDTTADAEEGVDVVVKVREPRRSRTANDQITGIEGSTRMEAKKQRRREGRAAGRRRAPILSEAEFLARREAVDRMMLIRQADDYTQIAVMEDGVLVEHYVDRDSAASMIGNIYLGRVQNVLPSMEAAFVDIGRGRNAVLYAGEVDWEGFGVVGAERKVEKVLKSGQPVLVQVTKDPVGAKGARLTSHISIPGRYVVYSPGGQLSGISRKLPDTERQRLKGILDELIGEDASVIVRTAAEGASEEELVRDVSRLKAQWEVIDKKVKAGQAPQMLYSEPDLTVRIVRDLFTEDFSKLVVDGNGQGEDAYDTVQGYVTHVAPHLQERLTHWNREADGDVFEKFRVNEQVAKALERKVHLPSGGSLIIDRTEAMTVIDVNTGKFTGTQGNLEATVTSNNLEAAEEIVRQLRLRDIGGIIVIDFIDMVLPANRELLLRRLVECLGRDRTRHQVAEVTSLGLVQMTRKKIGTGLAEAFTVPCETCKGRGYHTHEAPVATQAPADGGDRDHNGGRRGRGNSSRSGGSRRNSGRDDGAAKPDAPEPSGSGNEGGTTP